jgi:hypothetical protein
MPARCPHCQVELPEAASFCGACGRRIAGWSHVPAKPPAEALPGGEEPTRQMEPTPSLLRLAKLVRMGGKAPQRPSTPSTPSGELRIPRRSRAPLIVVALLALAGAAGSAGFVVAGRARKAHVAALTQPSPEAPAATEEPSAPVPTAPAPTAPAPPPPAVAQAAPAHPTPVIPKSAATHTKSRAPHRVTPVPVAVTAGSKKTTRGGGALPHKSVATDSKAIAPPAAPAAAAPPPSAPALAAAPPARAPAAAAAPAVLPEELPTAATPQTEEEQRAEGEARIDADGVRFVVRAHLPQVHACYGRAFKEGSPGGKVEIAFSIDTQGRAKNVRTETNSTESEQLARCLEGRVKEWQFPRPVGGDYELIYPFVFAPGS